VRWHASGKDVSESCETQTKGVSADTCIENLARIIQIALRVILENTKDFEVSGDLAFAKMPEMGIMSCPLKMTAR
jgi:hypothetical protein